MFVQVEPVADDHVKSRRRIDARQGSEADRCTLLNRSLSGGALLELRM